MSLPSGNYNTARSPPLEPGIVAFALVSAIGLAATLILIATTALHAAWSDACFQGLAAAMVAASVFAHTRHRSPGIACALGVVCGALPSLGIAAWHATDHWDDFMTWLPNALYLWQHGAFPIAAAPPLVSALPGYPPAASIVLAAVWSVAGEVVEAAGPVINVACLMILPGLVLRTLRVGQPRGLPTEIALGAALALATTILNVGLDWHWVLSSLPDTATLVAFAVAFRLAAEFSVLGFVVPRSHVAALAAVLGLIANLKQTGIVLVALLVLGVALVAISWIGPAWRHVRFCIGALFLVCIPSLAVWWGWHVYLTRLFSAYVPSLRPIDDWYLWLLPNFFTAIGRSMADHWLFFAPILVVVARGLYVLARRWLAGNIIPVSPADRLAAAYALVHGGYTAFLIICYLAAFDERDIRTASEWFRYQAHTGGAGLLVASMLAVERWRVVFGADIRRRPVDPSSSAFDGKSIRARLAAAVPKYAPAPTVAIGAATMALLLAASVAVARGPGIFHAAAQIDPRDLREVRRIGQAVGRSIAKVGKGTAVELITYDQLLPVLIVRYDAWANAWSLIRAFDIVPADDAGPDMAHRYAQAERRGIFAVALKHDGRARCAFWGHPVEDLLLWQIDSAACRLSRAGAPHDPTGSP
jgi:hypothetical protein